jgi:hypothetical protein
MLGLYGIYTPIGPEVGVNRSMVINPKIKSTRGFIQPFDIDNADQTNLFSIGELLNVFTPKHSDSPRAVMATVQGKHLTPTKVQHPYLIGNGTDLALAHMIGQEFAFKAMDDGVIESIRNELATVKYKDGTRSVINLKGYPAKNSGGGFYTENRLELKEGYKVGTKVKKGEIIAVDKSFFKETLDGSVGFAGGMLAKVAVVAIPETFEDSAVFTNRIVEGLSSEVINERKINLSANSRIIKMVKVGDKVTVNEPLVVFEDVGSNEEMALKALEKLDSINSKLIDQEGRSVAKAKYSGEIFDIQIYYNREIEDLHPTLQTIVKQYINSHKSRSKLIEQGRDDELVHEVSTEKTNSDKIIGEDVDGVLIRFFIKHVDEFKVGDKACFAIAVKTIAAEILEDGMEPFSEYKPEEHIDALVSPLSLVSRMVPDLHILGLSNKVILSLEEQVIALLEE